MEQKFELIVDWENQTVKIIESPKTKSVSEQIGSGTMSEHVAGMEEEYKPKPGGFVQQARAAAGNPKRDQLDHLRDLAIKGQWGEAEWKKVTFYVNPETGKESYTKSLDEARKTAEFYKGKGWATTKKFGQWIKNGEALNMEILGQAQDSIPF